MTGKKIRIFRGEEKILTLLAAHSKSLLSIKTFCVANNIPSATFHNWRKRYGKEKVKLKKQPGFTTFQISSSTAGLFAEVNGVRLYQPVSAAYLKELTA